jgi:hypothetical protein
VSAGCRWCGFDPAAVVTARWQRFFPRQPPSQNDFGKSAGARRKYTAERQTWEWEMRAWALHSTGPSKAAGPRRVFFERFYHGAGTRDRDRGNLIGGMKPILDAITREGLIVDDTPRWCADFYSQQRDELRSGLLITLEDLEVWNG